jgi:hypothetical protein
MLASRARARRAAGRRCASFECQRAASAEELVSLHDVQAYRQPRCQNSRCQFGAASSEALLERHRPAGGTAASAGVPSGVAFRRPVSVVSLSLGACWKNPQRGFEEREPSGWPATLGGRGLSVGLSAWPMLTSPLKSAPALASAAPRLRSRLAPRCCFEPLWWLGGSGAPGRQLPG